MIKRSLAIITAAILLLVGCGKQYQDLESYIDGNEKYGEEINEVAGAENIDVAIEGNTMTLTYDFGEMDDYDFEIYSSVLESMGDEMGKEMIEVIDDIESETHLTGVTVKVVFTGNGKTIWKKEYVNDKD